MVPPYFTQPCHALITLTPCFTSIPTLLSEYLLQDYLPAAPAPSSTNRKLSLPEICHTPSLLTHLLPYYKQKTAGFQPLFSFLKRFDSLLVPIYSNSIKITEQAR